MSNLTLYESGSELSISRPPKQVLAEAQEAAAALHNVVENTGAVIAIGQSQHLKAEAWQTLGHFYGLAARTPEDKTRFVEYGEVHGFEATAELHHVASGKKISEATSMCLSDEERWSTRTKYETRGEKRVAIGTEPVPLFQLRSMAQTRAISRAHANVLKWVVVLAGYDPTPAEEATGASAAGKKTQAMPQRKSRVISEPQRKRLYALAKQAGCSDEEFQSTITRNGFKSSKDVTRDVYEAICATWQSAAPARSTHEGGAPEAPKPNPDQSTASADGSTAAERLKFGEKPTSDKAEYPD